MTTNPTKRIAPPSGYPPPVEARLPDDRRLDLRSLAQEICRRYRSEFPDEDERYGEAGMAWCVHDNQHILNWTAQALHRLGVHLDEKIAWLASVLEARDFPLDRLARNLELAADVVSGRAGAFGDPMATRLREAAQFVRSQPSFL